MCRAENKASNHRSAKTLAWPTALQIHTRGAGNQDEWRRPLPHCPSSGHAAPTPRCGRRGCCGVSKHSPTILTAGRRKMRKKEKKARRMEGCSISPLDGRSNSCRAPAPDSASLGGSAGKNKPSPCAQPYCPARAVMSY